MKNIRLLFILFIGIVNNSLSQDSVVFKHQIQANYLMKYNEDGNSNGFQVEYNNAIFQSNNLSYKLSLGGVNEFFVTDERDIEGITGNTISNILGATVSNSFYFLNTKKLYFTNTIHLGWGHRRTKANYTNEQFSINRDYKSSFNYFAFGAYWKIGYQIKDKISIQAIGKTDLSRLVDKYASGFDRPGFMYGVGIVYLLK